MKKTLSLALSFAVIFSCVFVVPAAVSAEAASDGYSSKNFYSGVSTTIEDVDLMTTAFVIRPDKINRQSRNADLFFGYGRTGYASPSSYTDCANGIGVFFKFTDDGLIIYRKTWGEFFTVPKADEYVFSIKRSYRVGADGNYRYIMRINNSYYTFGYDSKTSDKSRNTGVSCLVNAVGESNLSTVDICLKGHDGNVNVSYKTQTAQADTWVREPFEDYVGNTAEGYDDFFRLPWHSKYTTTAEHDMLSESLVIKGINMGGDVDSKNRMILCFSKTQGASAYSTDGRFCIYIVKTGTDKVKISLTNSIESSAAIDLSEVDRILCFSFANGKLYVNGVAVTDSGSNISRFLSSNFTTGYVTLYNENAANTQSLSVKFVPRDSGDFTPSGSAVGTIYDAVDDNFTYILKSSDDKIVSNENHDLRDEVFVLKGLNITGAVNTRINVILGDGTSTAYYDNKNAPAQASNGHLFMFIVKVDGGLKVSITSNMEQNALVPIDEDNTYAFRFTGGSLYINDTKVTNAKNCISNFLASGKVNCKIIVKRDTASTQTLSAQFVPDTVDNELVNSNAVRVYNGTTKAWNYKLPAGAYISTAVKHNALGEYFVVKGMKYTSGRVNVIFNDSQTAMGSNGADGAAAVNKFKDGRLFMYLTAGESGYTVSLTDSMGEEAVVPYSDDGSYVFHFEGSSLYINNTEIGDRDLELGGYIKSFIDGGKNNCYFSVYNETVTSNLAISCKCITRKEDSVWNLTDNATGKLAPFVSGSRVAFGSYSGTDNSFATAKISNTSDISRASLKITNLDISVKTPEDGINAPKDYNQAVCVMFTRDIDTDITGSSAQTFTLMLRQVEDTNDLSVSAVTGGGAWQVAGNVDAANEYNIRVIRAIENYYLNINDCIFAIPGIKTFAEAQGNISVVIAKSVEANSTAISASAALSSNNTPFSLGDINLDGTTNVLDFIKIKKVLENQAGYSITEMVSLRKALLGCYSTDMVDSEIVPLSPALNENVSIANDSVYEYSKNYTITSSDVYANKGDTYPGNAVELAWSSQVEPLSYTLKIARNEYLNDALEIETTDNQYQAADLFAGTTYYWQVTAEFESGVAVSQVFTFDTAKTPRTIKIDGVSNTRDIGGYITEDGKRVKQGMVYRGANVDKVTADGISTAIGTYGIKTDIDLRAPGDGTAGTSSPFGESVNYVNVSGVYYMGTTGIGNSDNWARVAAEIETFANPAAYPIYFHCAIGRDRTGTLAMLISGLLGVKKEDIFMDYELSFFSKSGCSDFSSGVSVSGMVNTFNITYNYLAKYGGEDDEPFSTHVERYMLDIGVSQQTIDAIRSNLLEEP